MSYMAGDAKTYFSSKVEYHAVFRFLHLKGKAGKGNTRRVMGLLHHLMLRLILGRRIQTQ